MYPYQDDKRAFGSSFALALVVILGMAATATSLWIAYWLALVLLILEVYRSQALIPRTGLFVWVGGFCVWLLVHSLLIAPVFKPEAIYIAVFLLFTFLLASRLPELELMALGKRGVLVVAVLALWGLVQHWFGILEMHLEGGRAHAWFDSPNTFASVINIALLPVIVAYLAKGDRRLLALTAVLFLGLLATQSRGGLLAFVVGLAGAGLLYRRSQIRTHPGAGKVLVLVLALSVDLEYLPFDLLPIDLEFLPFNSTAWSGHVAEPSRDRVAASLAGGDSARADLYQLAITQILDKPWLGQGYLSFKPLYRRSGLDLFAREGTDFVHNDYLQIRLEIGIIGFVALLAIVLHGGLIIWRNATRLTSHGRITNCMLGGVLVSIAAHAVVDFPLYAPMIVILFGLGLGWVNRMSGSPDHMRPRESPSR